MQCHLQGIPFTLLFVGCKIDAVSVAFHLWLITYPVICSKYGVLAQYVADEKQLGSQVALPIQCSEDLVKHVNPKVPWFSASTELPWGSSHGALLYPLAIAQHHNSLSRFRSACMCWFFLFEINADLLKRICFTARGQLPPLCSFFGGVAAQEVIKAVTCRFTPLNQWVRSTISLYSFPPYQKLIYYCFCRCILVSTP